jgi:hypothetical protein
MQDVFFHSIMKKIQLGSAMPVERRTETGQAAPRPVGWPGRSAQIWTIWSANFREGRASR